MDARARNQLQPSKPSVPSVPAHKAWKVFGAWLAVVTVSALIGLALTLVLAGRQQTVLLNFLIMTLISLCFAGAYIALSRLVLARLLARSERWWQRASLHLLVLLAATAIGSQLACTLLVLLGVSLPLQLRFRIIGVGFAVLAAIRLVELGYERLREQVRRVELREERARHQALHAELAALQARTDPHFLFNALNMVAGLIEEDPQRAVQVVTRLGTYFRSSLQASRTGSVALATELESVATYLEIQSLRFGDRLRWKIAVAPDLGPVQMPPLLLQPLVENAVVHGTSVRGRTIEVLVTAEQADDQLRITVEDNGPGPGSSSHRGAGTSLADMAERLELLFAGAASLSTGAGTDGGYRACLELPRVAASSEGCP